METVGSRDEREDSVSDMDGSGVGTLELQAIEGLVGLIRSVVDGRLDDLRSDIYSTMREQMVYHRKTDHVVLSSSAEGVAPHLPVPWENLPDGWEASVISSRASEPESFFVKFTRA